MTFVEPDAQDPLRARVRALLAEVSPPAEVRRRMEDDGGYDLDAWLHRAAIAGGLCTATLAAAEASGRWDAGGGETTAQRTIMEALSSRRSRRGRGRPPQLSFHQDTNARRSVA